MEKSKDSRSKGMIIMIAPLKVAWKSQCNDREDSHINGKTLSETLVWTNKRGEESPLISRMSKNGILTYLVDGSELPGTNTRYS